MIAAASRLRRLWPGRRPRRIPHIQQTTSADCSAACLAMVLNWFGRHTRLDDVRNQLGVGRDGANANGLIRVAARFGLRGRGIALDLDDIDYLRPATVLHWQFKHFVVYQGHDAKGVDIVDPGIGPRRVTMEEFGRSFTGVAIEFEPADTFEEEARPASLAWRYVRRVLGHSGLLARILSLSAMVQVVGLGVPVLTGMIVDRVVPDGDGGLLVVLAAGIAGLIAFHFLASTIRSFLLLQLRTELDARMTLDFLGHLFDLPFSYFQIRSAGDLMMRLNSNSAVREIISSAALSGALDGLLVVSYLVMLMLVSPWLGLLVLGLGLGRVSLYLLSRRRIRDLMTENLAKQAASESYQVQMFAGIETLKAAGAEPRALQHWSNLFVDVLNVNVARGRVDALIQSAGGALGYASPLAVLLVGAHLVLQGQLGLGTMLAMNALAAGFLMPLTSLVDTAIQFQTLGSYLDRLDDVLAAEKEQDPQKVAGAPSLKGGIEVEGVTFHYNEGGAPTLSDVSVRIEPGQLVAIVGRSGAGKTTLANLIIGLQRPTRGRVLFDGHDLRGLEVRSVRQQIGVVVQNTHLFGTSIRENISLADPSLSLEDVARAARRAHIHDEIAQLPMGYDTMLADGGHSVSGGQRQRIALARALVKDPVILFLDEATNALDAEIEQRIQASIEDLGCTRIVVAHRLSTIRAADQILVLDAGRLVECGTHAELSAAGGLYARLVAAQTDDAPAGAAEMR